MRIPVSLKRQYQKLRDVNYAVFGVIATVVYSGIYVVVVPFVWLFSPNRKKISHSAWTKWAYKSGTIEDLKKQY